MEENIEALNHCVGYGNPSANYWFFSLEDGGGYCDKGQEKAIDFECKERELQRLELYKKKFADKNFSAYHLTNQDLEGFYSQFPEEREKASTDFTYENYCSIYNSLNNDNITPKSIGDSESKIFISNLFPISRSNSENNFDPFVKEFIFNGTFEEWEEKYWSDRKKYISDFFKNRVTSNTYVTILFLGVENKFNELLNEMIGKKVKLEFERKLIFKNFTLLQTYHAGRRTTYNKKFNIESILKLLLD
jgi:hypothetical protein